jgi:hypothetical protein
MSNKHVWMRCYMLYAICFTHLHCNSSLIAIQVGIDHELSDRLDDLLQNRSLQNLGLEHGIGECA